MLAFIVLVGLFAVTIAQENTILKQEKKESLAAVNVIATPSHKYVSNTSPTKIAMLFDITTSQSISSDSENKDFSQRSPYELAIVLDRSGSMNGNKIEQAKLAMLGIVDNMIDGDIIHLIQYDHDVEVWSLTKFTMYHDVHVPMFVFKYV